MCVMARAAPNGTSVVTLKLGTKPTLTFVRNLSIESVIPEIAVFSSASSLFHRILICHRSSPILPHNLRCRAEGFHREQFSPSQNRHLGMTGIRETRFCKKER